MSIDEQMTPEGYAALKTEVEDLEGRAREEIAENIRVARSFGDLKENAEYHEAKRAQGHLETRIARLDAQLRSAVVMEASAGGDVVAFGSQVTVRDEASDREATYTIVGPTEAKAGSGALSSSSPVARALLGARPGETVQVEAPSGTRRLTVLTIA